jgi:hypothetical protein
MGSAGAAVPMLKRPGRRGRRQSSNTISKLKRPLRFSEPQNSTSKLKGKPARLAQPRIIMSLRSFGDTCLPYILVSIKTLRALVPPTSTWHRQHPNPAVVTCTKDTVRWRPSEEGVFGHGFTRAARDTDTNTIIMWTTRSRGPLNSAHQGNY